MASVQYVTREEVKNALDVRETSRSNAKIDRVIEASSRQAEAILHRRFYPEIATRSFPWPSSVDDPGVLWLDDNELISTTAVTSAGTAIGSSSYYLEPNASGPPYNRIEISRGGVASFGGGYSQRDIVISGTFGYKIDETPGPVTAGAIAAGDTSVTTGPGFIGTGALIRIDSERMIVTGKSSVSTGQTLSGNLLAAVNGTLVGVQNGAQISAGETILIDAEYMRVVDVAGNNLIVQRAWDGSILAAHTAGATLYAMRKLTVARGQLGTAAAAHADASTTQRFVFPGPLRNFVLALTLDTIEQESTGYARTTGSGNTIRDTGGRGLEQAGKLARTALGRFNRTAAV